MKQSNGLVLPHLFLVDVCWWPVVQTLLFFYPNTHAHSSITHIGNVCDLRVSISFSFCTFLFPFVGPSFREGIFFALLWSFYSALLAVPSFNVDLATKLNLDNRIDCIEWEIEFATSKSKPIQLKDIFVLFLLPSVLTGNQCIRNSFFSLPLLL